MKKKHIFFLWILLITILFLYPSASPSLFKNSDKILHVLISFFTAFLYFLSFKKRKNAILEALLFTIFYGAFIEILQGFTPLRSSSLMDWLSDILGAFMFYLSSLLFPFFLKEVKNG